jgi:rubrerythrin
LSSAGSAGCFFLDTSVVLSRILGQNTQRIEKLKNDSGSHNIPCYVSNSVQQEIEKKVRQTSDFLGNVVRETIKYHLEESRKNRNVPVSDPLTSNDILALEDLFYYYYNAQKKTKVGLTPPIASIEEWTISFLAENLDKGVKIDINSFLRQLVKGLLTLTSEIEELYNDLITFQKGFVKVKSVILDDRIVSAVETLGIHKPDSNHIASAIIHQTETNEKSVFVTSDFGSILDQRETLLRQFRIECCDPLYALHHMI